MAYRIMVVDDSAFMRKIVSDLIEQDPAFKVIGTARNGREAIEQIAVLSPDLVTMDVEMPELNGLDALKIIMERHPLPVIMLSGINEQGMRETIMALELGAFDFIRKPSASTNTHDIGQVRRQLHEQIRTAMLMKERKAARESAIQSQIIPNVRPVDNSLSSVDAELRKAPSKLKQERGATTRGVDQGIMGSTRDDPAKRGYAKLDSLTKANVEPVRAGSAEQRRISPAIQDKGVAKLPSPKKSPTNSIKESLIEKSGTSIVKTQNQGKLQEEKPGFNKTDFTDIVAIGTSTGGPKALKAVLENIPRNFPAPIVIVQHMPPNFTKSLAQRLNSLSPLHVIEAEEGSRLLPGTAYIAPGGFHMSVIKDVEGYKVSLSSQAPRNGHRPSVEVLYESLLPLKSLRRHIVLLTGMGSDGAKAMKQLYEAGVTSTIAESEETCVVYGMPRSAIELNCVNHVLPLQEIGPKLVQVVK
ncbi:protein-glutamate methylesterase/protein-glutamine glutaminase [Paenibacillus lentus]|uniref:Protein-glutamate methylesterase/protein-glutamine glutaminase n=1 Tax=Paenibacillus lentus TaxID=1338368 RepID=A0A3Q8SCX3_9BACL|nr:chemotaxis response regulator protein-glutamate methylesterase [Paenibacillus lentus]AZK47775.1 chemotaxis response regulator protein-glutamate methylesterase [Paenibacillus lentus]